MIELADILLEKERIDTTKYLKTDGVTKEKLDEAFEHLKWALLTAQMGT